MSSVGATLIPSTSMAHCCCYHCYSTAALIAGTAAVTTASTADLIAVTAAVTTALIAVSTAVTGCCHYC